MQVMTPEQIAATQPRYEITDADRERVKKIADAWKAYDGELDPPLKPMPDQPDDNVMGNYIEDKMDARTSFLFGKEVQIKVEEGAPEEAQTFLDETWGEEETRIPLLQEMALNGEMSGQAFLRIVPNRDGSFRLVATDPSTVYVKWAPQDCRTVLIYCIEYCSQEKGTGNKYNTVYYREEITRVDPEQDDPDSADAMSDTDTTWVIQHWSRIGDRGNWIPAGDPILWNYAFPPIFSNQNAVRPNSFWGKPGTTKSLIGLNKSLNTKDSDVQKLGRLYSHPILHSNTGNAPIDHTPGRITQLPPDGEIKAVDIHADIPALLSATDRIVSRVDEQTAVPGIATGRASAMPGGNMSGIAIQLLFMSLLKLTDTRRCLYGKTIIDVSRALLVLAGFSPDIKVSLEWQNPLPADLQAALAEQQLGVSKTTTLLSIGRDPEQEAELKKQEDEQTVTAFSRGQGFPPAPPMMQQDQQLAPGQEPAQAGGVQ